MIEARPLRLHPFSISTHYAVRVAIHESASVYASVNNLLSVCLSLPLSPVPESCHSCRTTLSDVASLPPDLL